MSALDYFSLLNLNLKGIVGIPLPLNEKMFMYYIDDTVMPLYIFNNLIYSNLNGCKVVDYKIIPTSTSGNFKIASGHAETIYFTAKQSLQPPILMSTIKSTIGVNNNNLSVLNSSNSINLNSPVKPKKTAPFGMGEWINYCHSTEAGIDISFLNVFLSAGGGDWTCKCTLHQKDVIGYQYQPNNVKVDFYSTTRNILLASQTYNDFNYIMDVDLRSYINAHGVNNIACRVYLKDYSQNWILVTTSNTSFDYGSVATTYNVTEVFYIGNSLYLVERIFNGEDTRNFDIRLTISTYSSTIYQYSYNVGFEGFKENTATLSYFVGRPLESGNDLFTIDVKPSTSSTWINQYNQVLFYQLPNSSSN